MADILKDRSEMEERYKWDLTPLYKSDEAWEEDLKKVDGMLQSVACFAGTLNSASNIKKYLDAYYGLERKVTNLITYASLRASEDTAAAAAQEMYAKACATYVKIDTALSFADPEILELDEKVLDAIAKDPLLSDYGMYMIKLLRRKSHTLSKAEERVLASFGEVFAAPGNAAGCLMDADMEFADAAASDGSEHQVSQSSYIPMQMSDDRVLRKNSFDSYYRSYEHHINTFAATYAGTVKAAVAEAELRKYASSRELYMADENIPAAVYDNLIKTVRAHMSDMYRYVALRKEVLGLDELHYYDIYAPLAGRSSASYTYDEALQLLLEAVKPLGKKYAGIVREGIDNRWIDVYPNKGKRSGAFSSGCYDSPPYLLLNYSGTLDSVSTLAHEMGHSVHSYLSRMNQPPQEADYKIFVAEVASTVNENLLIEMMLRKNAAMLAKKPGDVQLKQERLSLLNEYLEGFKGTVFRQTMFAEFEMTAHKAAEEGEALNHETLDNIYARLIRDYFGPGLTFDDSVKYEWARIPHFYTPFYVYKYATSYSASVAISERILKEDEKLGPDDDATYKNPAVKCFLEFLSMGGSNDPLEELRHAGVDLRSPEPVDAALNKFAEVLTEAEKIVRELKNV